MGSDGDGSEDDDKKMNRGYSSKPKFDEFLAKDGAKDYVVFQERVLLYFDVNSVPAKRQTGLFLTSISQCVYKLIRDRVAPAKPKDKTIEELFKALDGHYVAKTNRRAERFKFNKVVQETGETVAEFLARIREAASDCDFGDYVEKAEIKSLKPVEIALLREKSIEDHILDRFVMGLNCSRIQQALLAEDPSCLEKAYEKARTMQMALEERNTEDNGREVSAIRERVSGREAEERRRSKEKYSSRARSVSRDRTVSRERPGSRDRREEKPFCGRCGRAPHPMAACPAKYVVCHKCRQQGHFAKWCRAPRNQGQSQENKIEVIASLASDSQPVKIKLNFNHNMKSIVSFVDPGSCSNLISQQFISRFFPAIFIKSYANPIRTFSEQPLKVLGSVSLSVEYEFRTVELQFLVVEIGKDFEPLVGRPGCDALFPGWRDIFSRQRILAVQSDPPVPCSSPASSIELVEELTRKFPTVFNGNRGESIRGFKADIILSDNHKQIVAKPYNIPFGLRDKVELELKRLVEEKVIVPCVQSRYASPIVVVPKQGSDAIRMCIDCKRTINKFVVNSNFYPLPHQDMIFAAMTEATVFCVLDLKNAYLQLELTEASKEYMTITTPFGFFQFQKLPFGVCAAPSIFQYVIDSIITGIPMTKAYLDDILIGGRTYEECKENLLSVLERLKDRNVKVNLEKCVFLEKTVKYLGHILTAGQISVNPAKLEALQRAPAPRNVKEVQSYVGLLNYFRKFIPSLSEKIQCLYHLLQKNTKFIWTEECEEAFVDSKQLISQDTFIKLFDPCKPTLLMCDASPIGVSAVLMQREEDGIELPVYYSSMILNETQQNYAQLHREGLAIIFGLKRFYEYLFGRKFTIVTDAQSIKEMFHPDKATAAVAAARIQRWGVYLSQFNYNIEHRSSSKMCVPDALSRLPFDEPVEDLEDVVLSINAISENLPILFETIVKDQENDDVLKLVKKYVIEGFPAKCSPEIEQYKKIKNSLGIEHNAVFFNDRVIIPKGARKNILYFLHQSHQGIVLMKKLARSLIYWPGLDKDIEAWIEGCRVCQGFNVKGQKKVVSKWPAATYPMERIHIDFFFWKGKVFLLIMDCYTKYIEVVMMKKTTAEKVIEELLNFFNTFGVAKTLVSDNGAPFNSFKFKNFGKKYGINILNSPPYNPQSNGQAEVGVRIIKMGLKKLAGDKSRRGSIEEDLRRVLADYRNSPRSSGDSTPLELLLSFKPKRIADLLNPCIKKVRFEMKESEVNVCKREQKNQYGEFRDGEHVYYLSHYTNGCKWIPGVVVGKTSNYIYKVKLESNTRLVHVSKLRKRKEQLVFPGQEQINRPGPSRTPEIVLRRSERLKNVLPVNYKE